MPVQSRVRVADLGLEGELLDTDCARAIRDGLPLRGEFTVWGDQLALQVPVTHEGERHPTRKVDVGDLAYWAEGRALLLFFGPTPMSPAEDPVPPRPVSRVGTVQGVEVLRRPRAKEAAEIVLEEAT